MPSDLAVAIPLFATDFRSPELTLWIDAAGYAAADRAVALKRIPGRRARESIEAYWVRAQAGALVVPEPDQTTIAFSTQASSASIKTLLAALDDHQAPFSILRWDDRDGWGQSPRLTSKSAAKQWISAELGTHGQPQPVPVNIWRSREIPLSALPPTLAGVHDVWLASNRRHEAALVRRLALARLERFTSFVTLPPTAPARFDRIGSDFASFDDAWRSAATGQPVTALPDPIYGHNLARQFTAAAQSRQPLAYQLVTAIKRADDTLQLEHHDTVLLPLASSQGPALLAAVIATPDQGA